MALLFERVADDDIKVVTSVSTAGEAEIIVARLLEDGIQAFPQTSMGAARAWSGSCDVYVKEGDLQRAREALKSDENAFSDEELTRLSEEAGHEASEG